MDKLQDNLNKYKERSPFGDDNYMEMIKSEANEEYVPPQHTQSNIKNDFYSMSEEMEDRPMAMGDRTNAEHNIDNRAPAY